MCQDSEPVDLSEASVEDLIQELLNRHEQGVVALMAYEPDGPMLIHRRWRGNAHTIVGLCHDAAGIVLEDHHARSRPAGGKEGWYEDGD